MSQEDYYSILQVDRKASLEVIKASYRALAFKYHPDRNRTPGAEEEFKKINQAFQVLSDEKKRGEYDLTLNRPPVVEGRQNVRTPAYSTGENKTPATGGDPSDRIFNDFINAFVDLSAGIPINTRNRPMDDGKSLHMYPDEVTLLAMVVAINLNPDVAGLNSRIYRVETYDRGMRYKILMKPKYWRDGNEAVVGIRDKKPVDPNVFVEPRDVPRFYRGVKIPENYSGLFEGIGGLGYKIKMGQPDITKEFNLINKYGLSVENAFRFGLLGSISPKDLDRVLLNERGNYWLLGNEGDFQGRRR
jgi:hypothetical protein